MAERFLRDCADKLKRQYSVSHPEWAFPVDSPLKYVDWVLCETIHKSLLLAEAMDPDDGDTVFEIGPGTGYLMFILRELYDCDVYGCDIPDRPLYKDMHKLLDITTVRDCSVGDAFLDLGTVYDYIVGTQISWMDNWNAKGLGEFLWYCGHHLKVNGTLWLFPNPKALHGNHHLFPNTDSVVLPHLGTGYIYRRDQL